ncbi:N-acetyl-gamma-glutamyl-phosphate reductase [Plantactinospora sp. B6F1]|uniref:N-acetyl-gamma-glutamyl-phosphate reductase n=1 Tax=Plantactinospora sp. B6F1 TaxID=3158971 RepID=UPI0032D8EF6E
MAGDGLRVDPGHRGGRTPGRGEQAGRGAESTGLTAVVVGAAGHTGGEVCRLLLGHPYVGEILPTSRSDLPFDQTHPNLRGCGLVYRSADEALDARPDVAFLCAPAGEAMRMAPRFLTAGTRVVDLGPDFRFADPDVYTRVYGRPHLAPELLAKAAYGVSELNRAEITAARLVANPGCYVITALLALYPLLGAAFVDWSSLIRISAINGTSGGGTAPHPRLMHAEVAGSMLSYSLNGHRHAPELETVLGRLGGRPVSVDLSTAYGPFVRGTFLTASLSVGTAWRDDLDRDAVLDRYRKTYGSGADGEYFVRVVDQPRRGGLNEKEYDLYPRLADVVGSNFCHVGTDYDATHAVIRVVAVTDNLGKGAAGSAIQNMNLLTGLPESTGLAAYAL